MSDDRGHRDWGSADPDDLDPVSGDPLDAEFDVEHLGEHPEPPSEDEGASATGEEVDYIVTEDAGASPVVTDDDQEEWPWDAPDPAPTAGPEADVSPDRAEAGGEALDTALEWQEDGDDLGLDAVAVPAEDAHGGAADRPAWDPPPSTDAMFADDDYTAPPPQPGPVEDTDAGGGFGDWHDGLDPFPDDVEGGDDPFARSTDEESGSAAPGPVVADGPAPLPDGGAFDEPGFDSGAADRADGEDEGPGTPPSARGDEPSATGVDEPADWATFTGEHYVRVSQSDYQELADLGADEPEAAQSAVAAAIPGIDTGVVGLEDVADDASPAGTVEAGPATSTDLGLRVLTGIGLLAVFAAALVHPLGLTVVAILLFALAAGEFYAVLVRSGQHPLSLFGLLGVAGGLVGTALWGLGAVPVAIVTTLVAIALYYALTTSHPDPLTDGGLTMMVVAWALLGAFVSPIIDSPDYRWWIAAVVVVVVAMDVGQFFVGRSMGSRPLAPVVSPKKTVEGLVGGAAVTVVVALVLSFFGPLTLPAMLALAAATIVLAPIGDLSVSLVKRIIGVKDMGTILPGHGGILDRLDGLLFVIPAAWAILELMGLLD